MKKIYAFVILSWVLLFCFCGCREVDSLEQGLMFAGDNRAELEKVLKHYRQTLEDSLKYKAACFLISNMRWHENYEDTVSFNCDLQPFFQQIEAFHALRWIGSNVRTEKFGRLVEIRDSIRNALSHGKNRIAFKRFLRYAISDLKNMQADFLITHIDHAVERWQVSPYAKSLSFSGFCEYILPYKAMPDGWYIHGKTVHGLLGNQLIDRDSCWNMHEIILRYCNFLSTIRVLLGNSFSEGSLGWQDIFLDRRRDCIDQCEFEVQAMRALGIPAAMVSCVANREFVGKHHYCTFIDTSGKRQVANAESNYLGRKYWGYTLNYRLNAFQFMYGAQEDSPYMLRRKGEQLPPGFRLPTIKEVTPDIRTTVPMKLSVPKGMKNRLVWLYTYSREEGTVAVTWGVVNEKSGEALFKYVIPGVVYFPAYLNEEGEPCFGGEPLIVEKHGEEGQWVNVGEMMKDGKSEDMVFTRKFPRKPPMLQLANEMIGSKFYGANRADGSDRVELCRIEERPGDYWNEYRLKGNKAYRYYIFEPVNGRSEASELEFLANKNREYANVAEMSPRQIFSPQDTLAEEMPWVRLLPETPDESVEFDGNVQTASDRRQVVFKLKEPQVVDCIRLVPRNADNILYPGEDCELLYWDKGWKSYARVKSRYNYLEFKQLPTDRLYWLKNHSRGKEEVPFLIIDGKQQFLYYDVLISPLDL